MKSTFKKEYVVQESDIDELNHVNNIRYIEWVQMISKEHWYATIQDQELSGEYFWVITSHFIEYKRSAFLNDEISIETDVNSNVIYL